MILSLVLGIGVILYAFIDLNSSIINAGGGSAYVYEWLTRGGRAHYDIFRDIPFLIALLLGVSQFMPEVLQKRIKLTLHLPAHELFLLYTMVLYGFLLMLAMMLVFMAVFFALDACFLTAEMHRMALDAFLPWILGGFTTYFFVAMIAMEPSWKYRFLYAVIVYELVGIFLLGGNMSEMYPLLLGIWIIASLGMLYTANRFKIGER